MLIHSLTLKNFKTHRDRHFTFAPGTNAICGENGAGKTSLLEAIAWVLFNYRGNYTKEDLIRNGCTSAEVMVEFTSAADGLAYVVRRHSSSGYRIFDPRLQQTLPYSTQEQVMPWLREHLGVAAGTDLAELFGRTVGVPQGMLTADFLLPPTQRRAVFDRILKVEDYRAAYKDLGSLQKYAQAQGAAIAQAIAQWEEQLQGRDGLSQRHQELTTAIAREEAELIALEQELQQLDSQWQALQAQAQALQTLTLERQRLVGEVTTRQQALTLGRQALERARQAQERCDQARSDYEGYQQAEADLRDLEQQQQQRQRLETQRQQQQQALASQAGELVRWQERVAAAQGAIAALAALAPQVAEQQALEARRVEIQAAQQALAQVQGRVTALTQQRHTLEQQVQQLQATVDRLQALEVTLAGLSTLEAQRDRLQQQRSRLAAAQQFEAELQALVTQGLSNRDRQAQAVAAVLADLDALGPGAIAPPVLSQITMALESGLTLTQDLLTQLEAILADLAQQTDGPQLEQQWRAVTQELAALAKTQAEVATLPQQQQQLAETTAALSDLKATLAHLETQLAQEETLAADLAQVNHALTVLDNPLGRQTLLAQQAKSLPAWQAEVEKLEVSRKEMQARLTALEAELAPYATLDAKLAAGQHRRQAHQAGYQTYLQHQQLAQGYAAQVTAVAVAEQAVAAAAADLAAVTARWETAQAELDPTALAQVEARYRAVRSQRDRQVGSLPEKHRLAEELAQQLTTLAQVAEQRDQAKLEQGQCDRILRFIQFARATYQEAGPRITERYVQQVSREADRLFRELMNRQNVALTWTRDYEIEIQEGADTRRFLNLSGGEQMCAALAVRLALLKVVATLDIAFFDEPTTNLDQARRERLAEAIGRIRTFSQLFVISHDDTFETATENVILVDRQV